MVGELFVLMLRGSSAGLRDLTDDIAGPRQRTSAPDGSRDRGDRRVREPVVPLGTLIRALAAKRRPAVFDCVLDGVSGGAIGGATPQAAQAVRAGGAE